MSCVQFPTQVAKLECIHETEVRELYMLAQDETPYLALMNFKINRFCSIDFISSLKDHSHMQ